MKKNIETWDLWYPKAGATGIPFARGRLDAADILLVHGCPPIITVHVRNDMGKVLARGIDLEKKDTGPITKLIKRNGKIFLEDIWPTEKEIGLPIILPGGEVGVLKKWWNNNDKSEWKWDCEFYNTIQKYT